MYTLNISRFCFHIIYYNENSIVLPQTSLFQDSDEESDDDNSKGYYEFINFDGLGHTIGKLYYGKYQIGSIRRVWKDDISGLGKSELEIMQNEIYARHGLIFKSSKAKSYFKSQKWYKPKFENVDKFLSEIEKGNLQYIEIMKVQLSD